MTANTRGSPRSPGARRGGLGRTEPLDSDEHGAPARTRLISDDGQPRAPRSFLKDPIVPLDNGVEVSRKHGGQHCELIGHRSGAGAARRTSKLRA